MEVLAGRGFVIEVILLKVSVYLWTLSQLKSKLEAEQQAQQMEFFCNANQRSAEKKN